MQAKDRPLDRRSLLAALGVAGTQLIAQRVEPKMKQSPQEVVRKAAANLSAKSQELLGSVLSGKFDGSLPAQSVQSLTEFESRSSTALMVDLLPLAASFAQPEISNFQVGALILGRSGRLYLGANLEIAGQGLSATVHAEQCAAANAYMHQEEGFAALAVTSAPCGLCRQFLWEMCYGTELPILIAGKPPVSLAALLPDAFGPKDLGLHSGALPVTVMPLRLTNPVSSPLAAAALESARISYAPYTGVYAGVALRTSDNKIYSGAYIENAAYNPSLPPLQAALAAMAVTGQNAPSAVMEAVLVEIAGKRVSLQTETEANLQAVSPSAVLKVLLADQGK